MNLIAHLPPPRSFAIPSATFDDWALSDTHQSLLSPNYPGLPEAKIAWENLKHTHPDLNLSISHDPSGKSPRLKLAKGDITLHCYRSYPDLAARVDSVWGDGFIRPDPGVIPIPPERIPAYNERKVTYDEADFITKLQKRFDEAQLNLGQLPNPNWESAVHSNEKENLSPDAGEAALFPDEDSYSDGSQCEMDPEKFAFLECYAYGPKAGNRLLKGAGISVQGVGKYLEDRFCMDAITIGNRIIPYFAIFDGHSGDKAAEFLKNFVDVHLEVIFYEYLKIADTLERDQAIFRGLKAMYLHLGRYFKNHMADDGSGSTALLAVVVDDALWVVNSGMSRAILCANGTTTALSIDSGLQTVKECRSVWKRGQNIFDLEGKRTVGKVDLSRGVAVDERTSGINPRGQIIRYELNNLCKGDNYLVMGSRGFFGDVSSEQVSHRVDTLAKQGCPPDAIAADLADNAIKAGSRDDVTALVINFILKKSGEMEEEGVVLAPLSLEPEIEN